VGHSKRQPVTGGSDSCIPARTTMQTMKITQPSKKCEKAIRLLDTPLLGKYTDYA
jgi:hypothetical protein